MKKRILLFCILVLSFCNAICMAGDSVLDKAKSSAIYQSYNKDGIKAAEAKYQSLKNSNALSEFDYFAILHLYYRKPQYTDKFIDIANDGIKKFPESYVIYSLLAEAYSSKGKYDEAINVYSKSIKVRPSEPAYYNRGELYYYSKKDYSKALSDYSNALKYASQYKEETAKNKALADIYRMIAMCNGAKNDFASALNNLNTAIKYNSSDADLYILRSRFNLSKLSDKISDEEYSKIVLVSLKDADTALAAAKKTNETTKYKEAQEYRKTLIETFKIGQ